MIFIPALLVFVFVVEVKAPPISEAATQMIDKWTSENKGEKPDGSPKTKFLFDIKTGEGGLVGFNSAGSFWIHDYDKEIGKLTFSVAVATGGKSTDDVRAKAWPGTLFGETKTFRVQVRMHTNLGGKAGSYKVITPLSERVVESMIVFNAGKEEVSMDSLKDGKNADFLKILTSALLEGLMTYLNTNFGVAQEKKIKDEMKKAKDVQRK